MLSDTPTCVCGESDVQVRFVTIPWDHPQFRYSLKIA
jgi:hypothetical protein